MAVLYLLGIFAARGSVGRTDLLLLAGLYAGFIGRIVLKDFRDVRGDALFGKRTFLVRHVAILGRGMLLTLYAHFAMLATHWSLAAASAVIGALTVIVTGTAFDVLRTGPVTDTFVPPAFAAEEAPNDEPHSPRATRRRGR